MKSTRSADGHFPYGGQPDYRNFLMPTALITQFELHNEINREIDDPLIVAKYFNPVWAQTWFMTEYDPDTGVFMGFVTGMPFPEWGSIWIRDFIDLELPFGMKIERDIHFQSQPFSEAVPESERQFG